MKETGSCLGKNLNPQIARDMRQFSATVTKVTMEQQNELIKQKLLAVLDYPEINERYVAIAEAYRKTFE